MFLDPRLSHSHLIITFHFQHTSFPQTEHVDFQLNLGFSPINSRKRFKKKQLKLNVADIWGKGKEGKEREGYFYK